MNASPELEPASLFSLSTGDIVHGKYRLDTILGRGGMGTVFLATHLQLDSQVAIKALNARSCESPVARGRFAREAKCCARIESDHVVRILDVDESSDGVPFIVMEYLQGTDLSRRVRREGPLPIPLAARYLLEACAGVAVAHALDIVHRDLKPANLFVARKPGGQDVIKLLDFGISKTPALQKEDLLQTAAATVLGSPSYMSPEQLRGAAGVDSRTDIWSLGITLYQLISGKLPFTASSATSVAARISTDPPERLSHLVPAVTPELERVILRCLEKDPHARYRTVAELARDLAPFTPLGEELANRVVDVACEITGEIQVGGRSQADRAWVTEALSISSGSDRDPTTQQLAARIPTSPSSASPTVPVPKPIHRRPRTALYAALLGCVTLIVGFALPRGPAAARPHAVRWIGLMQARATQVRPALSVASTPPAYVAAPPPQTLESSTPLPPAPRPTLARAARPTDGAPKGVEPATDPADIGLK